MGCGTAHLGPESPVSGAPCTQPGCGHLPDVHEQAGACFAQGGCACTGYAPPISGPVTVRTLMDLRAATWSELLGHADRPPGEEGRPSWRASMLGYCMRRQCMWRAGLPETRAETAEEATDKERRFAWGRHMEDRVVEDIELSGLLIARQIQCSDRDLEIEGNMDALMGGEMQPLPERRKWWTPEYQYAVGTLRERVEALLAGSLEPIGLEVKSTSSWVVRKMHDEGPRFDHRMQAGAYLACALASPESMPVPFERVQLVVVGRDAVRPLVADVVAADAEEARDRLGTLTEAWYSGDWPECTCGVTEGITWEQKFCPYLDPDDPSECCGRTMLQKLETAAAGA